MLCSSNSGCSLACRSARSQLAFDGGQLSLHVGGRLVARDGRGTGERLLNFNIAAMVVVGSGAVGKRMLCSSGIARDERKSMAMRHAVCKYWGFSLVNKVTLENLHGVPVAKRPWSASRLSPDLAVRAMPRQYWSASSESRTMKSLRRSALALSMCTCSS